MGTLWPGPAPLEVQPLIQPMNRQQDHMPPPWLSRVALESLTPAKWGSGRQEVSLKVTGVQR